MKKRYKFKYEYIAAAKKISKHITRESDMIFEEGSDIHRDLLVHNVLDLFCEELPQEVEQWKDVDIAITARQSIQEGALDKAVLLIRMQSWADFHNKLDGFVPNWVNKDNQTRYGIVLDGNQFTADWHPYNYFIFQICVSSKDRAVQMIAYFHKDIQSLIDKSLI